MEQKSEQEDIDEILNKINLIIEKKPYNKLQLVDFKNVIKKVHDIQNKDLLNICYNNQGIDIVSLICKHSKKKLLRYLLYESHVLSYFTIKNKDLDTRFREDALYYAICLDQFKIVEMLYDHWAGDLHCLGHKIDCNDFDVNNLIQINITLKNALSRYESWMLSKVDRIIDQAMMFNIQSLIILSEFQKDLYTKFNELKKNLITLQGKPIDVIRLEETEALCNMIIYMFDCYENHTNRLRSIIQNSVIEIPNEFNDLSEFLESPKDTNEHVRKTFLHIFFEVYFRKLDYNICLLILDNLHSLKLRLTMQSDSYQKLENKIFHYIYHLSSKWSLYISNRRNMKTKIYSGKHNDIECLFSIKYDENIFKKGLNIIYLERRDFESSLYVFKNELKTIIIKNNIREDNSTLTNEEVNCLMLLPELRDIYSLRRISQQIRQIYSIDVKYTKIYKSLLVERILQIVGEFLKCTHESLHLQPTTNALVEIEISVEIVNDLKTLRDFLSHAKNNELLKRIEIETNNNSIFDKIIEELKFIEKKIDKVIVICKPMVEKALILNGLSLIGKRKDNLPKEVANDWFKKVKHVILLPQNEPYIEFFWAPVGYAEEFATEVTMLVEHSLHLESKLSLVTENIRTNLKENYFMYKQSINNSLQKIMKVKQNWKQIVNSLRDQMPTITLSDDPNEKDFNTIKTHTRYVDLGINLNRLVEDNKLFAYAEMHWSFIKKILEFIIFRTEAILYTPVELNKIAQELKILSYTNNDVEKTVDEYLVMIEEKLGAFPNETCQNAYPDFDGIKELRRKLRIPNFLLQEEKDYLTLSLEKIRNEGVNPKRNDKIINMINKITLADAIPKNEFNNFTSTIKLDKKGQKSLMNLVMGYKRDPLPLRCLSNRISLLRELMKQQCLAQLVIQYKADKTFRAVLEVLVFDIFAILQRTKNNDIVQKSSKLLTEINLRNFLIHGGPLLEIVGNVLDSNDLPTELITKALGLVKEERSINALCALIDLGLNSDQIKGNNLLSPEQRVLIMELKMSAIWENYLVFIPKSKTQKKIKDVDKNLQDAVKNRDSKLVETAIAEGGNVNFIDDYNRALVHHAAIKGSVDVLKVLLDQGADVNIPTMYNMTALHYSAINGCIATVDLLLNNGADYLAQNERGQTPLDLATHRKHLDVCQMLRQAMKK